MFTPLLEMGSGSLEETDFLEVDHGSEGSQNQGGFPNKKGEGLC